MILSDESCTSLFMNFAETTRSSTPIMFWQEAEQYRKIPASDTNALLVKFQEIYSRYIEDKAPMAISIPPTYKYLRKCS